MIVRIFSLLIFVFISTSFATTQEEDLCFNLNDAGDYQRAIQVGQEILRKNPNSFDANRCLTKAYSNVGDFKEALKFAQNMENLAKTDEEFYLVYVWLSGIYYRLSDLDTALMYAQRALYFANKIDNKSYKIAALTLICSIYQSQKDYNKALRYYEEALSLNPNNSASLSNIAIIYSDIGDYKQALQYLKKALEVDDKNGDYHNSARNMLNIGDTYRRLGDYKEAESYITESLNRIKRIGDRYWEASAYKYLGWLYADMGQKDKAIEYLKQAKNIFESVGAKNDVKDVESDIGLIESGKWVPVASQNKDKNDKQEPAKKPVKKEKKVIFQR